MYMYYELMNLQTWSGVVKRVISWTNSDCRGFRDCAKNSRSWPGSNSFFINSPTPRGPHVVKCALYPGIGRVKFPLSQCHYAPGVGGRDFNWQICIERMICFDDDVNLCLWQDSINYWLSCKAACNKFNLQDIGVSCKNLSVCLLQRWLIIYAV